MDNVYQMSARNIPDLSRTNHVTNMLVESVYLIMSLRSQVTHLQVRSYQDCIYKCISYSSTNNNLATAIQQGIASHSLTVKIRQFQPIVSKVGKWLCE